MLREAQSCRIQLWRRLSTCSTVQAKWRLDFECERTRRNGCDIRITSTKNGRILQNAGQFDHADVVFSGCTHHVWDVRCSLETLLKIEFGHVQFLWDTDSFFSVKTVGALCWACTIAHRKKCANSSCEKKWVWVPENLEMIHLYAHQGLLWLP